MMFPTIYLVYILSFVIGMIIGLLLSYKKYTEPFVSKNVDLVALVISIIGWILFLNSQLITLIPQYISIMVFLHSTSLSLSSLLIAYSSMSRLVEYVFSNGKPVKSHRA